MRTLRTSRTTGQLDQRLVEFGIVADPLHRHDEGSNLTATSRCIGECSSGIFVENQLLVRSVSGGRGQGAREIKIKRNNDCGGAELLNRLAYLTGFARVRQGCQLRQNRRHVQVTLVPIRCVCPIATLVREKFE